METLKSSVFEGNEELEIQIFNPVLNEGLYLAQDLNDPSSPDEVLFHRGELLTVFVLNTLSVAGYDFIPCMKEEG
jgi:hypothetical protein